VGRAIGMALRRPEAGGRDPVLRLHLARHDANPLRNGHYALALERDLRLPVRAARAHRRLSERRRHLPQPMRAILPQVEDLVAEMERVLAY